MIKTNKNCINVFIWAAALLVLSCRNFCDASADFTQISGGNPAQIQLQRTSPYPQKYNSVINIKAVRPTRPDLKPGENMLDEISKYFNGKTSSEAAQKPISDVSLPAAPMSESEYMIKTINDAFAPPVPNQSENNIIPENSAIGEKTSFDNDEFNSENSDGKDATETVNAYYSAEIDESFNPQGRRINSIVVKGLEHIDSNAVYSCIKSNVGDDFDYQKLQEDLQNIYASGYFTDNIAINPTLNSDGTVDLIFELKENLYVSNVEIFGNTVIRTSDLEKFVVQLKGMPQNIRNINKAIEEINEFYHKQGYMAEVKSVDDDSNGNLKFYISEGVINKILIEGNQKTKNFVIERNIHTLPGTVYNEEQLKKDIAQVYATNIFKNIDREIVPIKDGEKGEYDVKLKVEEASTNNITIGAGLDNALGLFGQLSINENNFMGRGQKVSLSGMLGSGVLLSDASIKNRVNYQVELNFFEPHFLNADNSLLGKIYFRELGSYQVPLAIERRFGIMASAEHKVMGYDGLTTSLSAGLENISLSEGDLSKISSIYAKNNIDMRMRSKELTGGMFFNVAPGVRYSSLDTTENPRNGIIASAKFQESLGINHLKNTNGRLIGGATKYFPIAKKSSLALTARGGLKVHGSDLPEVMALSLGGPYTVRGFRMNGVGSGDGFIMGSAELATPLPFVDKLKYDFFKKIRFTVFVDAGKVYDGTIASTLYDRPMSAISIGFGLKFYIPNVGPISIDYGIPLTNPGHYGSKSGYFTFGTGMLDMYRY